jgi:hypothetical protein
MSAITINTPRKHRDGHGGAIKPYVVKNLEVIPAGAFVGLDANGYLVNWTVVTAGSLRFVGMAMSKVTGDGTLTMPVNDTGIELRGVPVAGASTISDLTPGKVYLLNNNDLSISAPAAGGVMGRITKFYDSTHFDVKIYTSGEYAAEAGI